MAAYRHHDQSSCNVKMTPPTFFASSPAVRSLSFQFDGIFIRQEITRLRSECNITHFLILIYFLALLVPRKYLPPVIHHQKTGFSLIALQFLLGAILVSLGFYLLLWSQELGLLNCPYWSGGMVSFYFKTLQKQSYHRVRLYGASQLTLIFT